MSVLDALPMSRKQLDYIGHSQAKINVAEGSIRSGKTIAQILRWLIYCANPPRGGSLVIVGKTLQSVARNVLLPMCDPDLFGDLARMVEYTPGATRARILGQTVHVIGAADAKAESKVRGFTCSGALVDEGTLIPRDFWNQLLGRMSVAGSKVFVTTNPDNPAHWFRKEVILAGQEDTRSWHFTLDDNTHLDPEYVRWIKAQYVGLFYRRFIEGKWIAADGAVYDMFDEERHVVDGTPDFSRIVSVGIDYGTTSPTHATMLGIGMDKRLYALAEWRYDSRKQRRQLTDQETAQRLRDWLKDPTPDLPENRRLRNIVPPYLIVDPSAASFITQLHRDKMKPHPADNSVLDGIRLVSTLLGSGRLLIARRCTNLIEEFGGYSWDDAAALKGEDKPVKVDDHGLDSLRYGIVTTQGTWRPHVLAA